MIEFNNLHLGWLMLAIPSLLLIYLVSVRLRRARLEKYGDLKLVRVLMPLASRFRGRFKISLICVSIFFFVLALMQPRIGEVVAERKSKSVEVIIALDVSNSMLADDFLPSRLERAKLAITRLVDGLKGDRIGLIVFAGDAYVQLPVTNDYLSAKIFLNSINPAMVSRQGTNISKAIELSMKAFSSQSEDSRALIIITDGEDQEGNPVEAATVAGKDGVTIHTIGIGSPRGAPIRMPGGDFLKDKNGQVVISKLDQLTLQRIAGAGGGTYTLASPSDLGLNPVMENVREMEKKDLFSSQYKSYFELFYVPLALALILLAAESFIFERKNKLFRKLNLFGKNE